MFANKHHMSSLALKDPKTITNIKDDHKIILANIFTHTESIKLNQEEMIGSPIKQYLNIETGEYYPKERTFTFFSAIESKIITPFKSFKILNEYNINTLRELLIFRFFEDIKMTYETNIITEKGGIFLSK